MPGKVIVQSYHPENFSIQCARKQNYEMFYETEITLRKQLKYPPFCDIIVISFSSLKEKEIQSVSRQVYEYLQKNLKEEQYKIFKPMPSPIDKIQNKLRYRIIIKGNMTDYTNDVLNKCLKQIYNQNKKDTKVMIDINPNNMS